VLPKFVRDKFAGVQQPLGRWILRHILEFIVLSPAILVTWLYLKLRHKEVLTICRFTGNISMFINPLEPELRRRKKTPGLLERTIVINLWSDANTQVRKMYDRVVKIYGAEAKVRRRIIWWASQKFVSRRELFDDQSDPMWREGQPTVSFTPEEEIQGQKFLDAHNLKKNEFCCVTVRSESYYRARIADGNILKPQTLRNPAETTYLDVSSLLIDEGLKVLRVGIDMPNIPSRHEYKNIIDYSSKYRSDFLDVYLLRYCKFLVTGGAGIMSLRWMWNLPSVFGDSYLIWRNQICYDILLQQRVWLEKSERFATFSEMLSLHGYSEEKHQQRLGIRLIKNTVEEIKSACDEMNARIDGTWVTTEEDEELQRRYQDLIVKHSDKPEWNGKGRVGAQFLRDNQDLLR